LPLVTHAHTYCCCCPSCPTSRPPDKTMQPQMEQAQIGLKRKRAEDPQGDMGGHPPCRPPGLPYKKRLMQQWQQQQQQQRVPVLLGGNACNNGGSSQTAAVGRSSSPASCSNPQQHTEALPPVQQVVRKIQQATATAAGCSTPLPRSPKKVFLERYLQGKAAAAALLAAYPEPAAVVKHPSQPQQTGASSDESDSGDDCEDDCDSGEWSSGSVLREGVYSEQEVTSGPCSSCCSSNGSAW
jgi:hypothetical protein